MCVMQITAIILTRCGPTRRELSRLREAEDVGSIDCSVRPWDRCLRILSILCAIVEHDLLMMDDDLMDGWMMEMGDGLEMGGG